MEYTHIIRNNNTKLGTKRVEIICNTLIEPIFGDYLQYYNHQWEPQYYSLGSYLSKENHDDYCIVMLNIQDMFEKIIDNFYEFDEEKLAIIYESVKNTLNSFVSYLSQNHSQIVMFSFEKFYPADQWDPIDVFIEKVNLYLNSIIEKRVMVLLDIHNILNQDKRINLIDNVYREGYQKYTIIGMNLLAKTINTYFEKWNVWRIKCIVLDCDNVLWGGIVGENENIKLGKTGRGKLYREFQRDIVRLYNKGVIICLCSKNDEINIWNMFDNDTNMLLKKSHISAYRINMHNKSRNIQSIIQQLNLCPDSVLFIDDDIHEIKEVTSQYPEINVLRFEIEKIHQIVQNIRLYFEYLPPCPLLDNRTKQYQQDSERQKKLKMKQNSIKEGLETKIYIDKVTQNEIYRIVELSQRTNQFNLSAKRYTKLQLEQRMYCENYDLFYLRAEDQFGDMGIVAAVVIEYKEKSAIIEAFFVSCRVFGRGFENILLKHVKEVVSQKKIKNLFGIYNINDKNKRFKNFYIHNNIKMLY